MRIVIDLQGAQTPFSKNRGVGRYTIELVKAMALNSRGHEIILALNGAFPDAIEAIRAEFENILPQERIKVWQQFFDTAAIRLNVWGRKAGEALREEFLNSLEGDIIFSTNLQEGFFDDACTSVKLFSTYSLICSTLHDVVPLSYPDEYLGNDLVREWYNEKLCFIKRSDIVITVSHYSREEISRLLEIPIDKIYVVYSAVNHRRFRPISIEADDKKALLGRLNVSHPFVMYAGGPDLHKNLDKLYSAFSKLPKDVRSSYQLVMVGEELKNKETIYHKRLKKMGIGDSVVFTGHVNDEELVMLYNLCDLFVFPSIHEGFGLPLLEAMACGAAVLTSNSSSLPEVVGYKDALFDPNDDIDIAKKIESALTDGKFRALLKEHAAQQASKFSWENSAKSLLILFEEVTKNHVRSLTSADRIQNIINYMASLSSSVSFNDKDLLALSVSIAETFCFGKDHRRRLFIDVSSTMKLGDYLTGIQRVVLAICNELINKSREIEVELVYTTTDDPEFYKANTLINRLSGGYHRDVADEWIEFCQGDTLLFLDLHPAVAISHKKKTQYLRNKGVLVYHVVYDILPVLRPEFFWPDLCNEFYEWLLAISNSDGAICISRAVADELRGWLEVNVPRRLRTFKIGWFYPGGDIENAAPTLGLPDDAKRVLSELMDRPSFLMVGTIEPRKGYGQTLAAFEKLWAEGLDANLIIIGRQGWITELKTQDLRRHPEQGKRLFWLEGISDEYLQKVYAAATCLIAASEGEGFGLPLIEASRHNVPIIARDIPVFREIAGDHAFYFKGNEPADIARAVREWMELYRLDRQPQSDGIPCLTWNQSAQQLMHLILHEQWQYRLRRN